MKLTDNDILNNMTPYEVAAMVAFMDLYDHDDMPDGAWFAMLEEGGQVYLDSNRELMHRVHEAFKNKKYSMYPTANCIAHAYLQALEVLQSIARGGPKPVPDKATLSRMAFEMKKETGMVLGHCYERIARDLGYRSASAMAAARKEQQA